MTQKKMRLLTLAAALGSTCSVLQAASSQKIASTSFYLESDRLQDRLQTDLSRPLLMRGIGLALEHQALYKTLPRLKEVYKTHKRDSRVVERFDDRLRITQPRNLSTYQPHQ